MNRFFICLFCLVFITINSSFAQTKLIGVDTICGDANVNLFASNDTLPIQWQRLIGGVFIDEIGADSTLYPVYLDSTTSFRTTKNGVVNSDTITVVVMPPPQPTLIPDHDSAFALCGNPAKLTLSVNNANPNKNYKWYDRPIGGHALEVGGNIAYISPNGDSISYYSTSNLDGTDKIDTFYVEELDTSRALNSQVLITDLSSLDPDKIEIQNVSSAPADLFGWKIAISGSSINMVNPIIFELDTVLNPGEFLYIMENNFFASPGLYWGGSIYLEGFGWLFIFNEKNRLVDAAFWGYDSTAIKTSNINIFGHKVEIGSQWIGDGSTLFSYSYSLIRTGNADNNDSLDFRQYVGTFNGSIRDNFFNTNQGLILPFSGIDCPIPRTPVVGKTSCVIADDLSLIAQPKPVVSNERCTTTSSELVEVMIINTGSTNIDFSQKNLNITVNVTGPISQTLTTTINTNGLNNGQALQRDSILNIPVGNIDMSQMGIYHFEAYLSLNADTIHLNDTLRTPVSNVISGGKIMASSDTICGGGSVVLSNLNSVGTVQWQRLIDNVFMNEAGADSTIYLVQIDSTTTFRVVSCGTAFSDTIQIHNFQIPQPPITYDASFTGCGEKTSVVLSASTSLPNTVINWYSSPSDKNIIHTGDSITVYKITNAFPSKTKDYKYATAFDTSTGCESSRIVAIASFDVVGDYPELNLGVDTSVCFLPQLILDAGSGAKSYLWNNGSSSQFMKPGLNYDSLYTVTVESNAGCISMDSVIVEVDSCMSKGSYYYYVRENFNQGIPSTWTNTAVSGNFDWMHGKMDDVTDNLMDVSLDGTPMVYFNDDSLGSTNMNNTVEIISPVLNPLSKYPLILEFDYNFRDVNGVSDFFKVEVFNGINWISVLNITNNSCGRWNPLVCTPPHTSIDISNYINNNLQVKFTYHDDNDWAYWAAFDNVEIYHPVPYNPIGDINQVDASGVADSLSKETWTTGTVAGIDMDGGAGLSFTIIDQVNGNPEGININASSAISSYSINQGDSINLIGSISQTNGLQQLIPDSIFIIDTFRQLPSPANVNILNEATESQIVQLNDMKVISVGTGSSFDVGLFNGIDTLNMHIDEDTDIDNKHTFNLGDELCSIIGIGGQNDMTSPYTGNYFIAPMRSANIVYFPSIDLGADTVVCDTSNFLLEADTGFVSYSWNTGDTTATIQPTTANGNLYVLTVIDSNGCSVSDSVTVNIDICTGLEERSPGTVFTVQPNPSKGIFHISGKNNNGETKIEVYNSNGKSILSRFIKSSNELNETIDLSDHAKGIYYIKLSGKSGFDVKKLVVQ